MAELISEPLPAVVCPLCNTDQVELVSTTVFFGRGFVDIDILDGKFTWFSDPEPDKSHKEPSTAVGFRCLQCNQGFGHHFDDPRKTNSIDHSVLYDKP